MLPARDQGYKAKRKREGRREADNAKPEERSLYGTGTALQ